MRTLALLALCATACGGFGDDDVGERVDAADTSDFGSSAVDAALCGSNITITPQGAIAPTTLTATVVPPDATMPQWQVVGPAGQILEYTALDASNARISVDATDPGTYQFSVVFPDGEGCGGGEGSVVVAQPQALTQAYRLRLTPPASSALPQQDVLVEVEGNTPLTSYTLVLGSGSTLGGTLTGPSGAIAGQVTLTAQSGPPVLVAVGTTGQFALPFSLEGTYSLLLTPTSTALAPHLIGPIDGVTLASGPFAVGTGVAVSGLVRDASQQPITGANVVLRSGLRPSGLGTSDSTGTYSLQVEPATTSLAVSAAGWPDLSLDGVAIAGATTLGVDESVTRLAVTLRAVRSDGTTPIANAHVTLRSAVIASAAVVHTSSGDLAASGQVHLDLVTQSDGTASVLVPASTYDVIVDPGTLPPGATDGVTGLHITIGGAGTVSLPLASLVTIGGNVVDPEGNAVAGASVRARPLVGALIVATTGSDGSFSLPGIGAGLSATLEVAPLASAKLAGTTLALGSSTTLGGSLPASTTFSLARGLEIAGTISTPGNGVLTGVAIDVLCATCGDPTPLYHTESEAGGTYTLYVPDPGVQPVVDGGAVDLD